MTRASMRPIIAILLLSAGTTPPLAQESAGREVMTRGLFLPQMDAAAGRALEEAEPFLRELFVR